MSYSRSIISRQRNLFGDPWDLPASRIRDQHFGLGLSDLDLDCPSTFYNGYYLRPQRQLSSGGISELRAETDKFQVRLDVGHFAPEEITVKTVEDQVVVTACHEEKVDEHGLISRQFTRRYHMPEGVEVEKVKSTLSADGILLVEAPRKRPQPVLGPNERAIPIEVQGPTSPVASKVTTTTSIPVTREDKKTDDKK